MRLRLMAMLLAVVLGQSTATRGDEPAPTKEELRAALTKALPLLLKGAVGHREQRSCFACHNQGIPLVALTTAKARGLDVSQEELDAQLKYIAEFLGKNRELFLKGKGTGGQVDTAGYALLALEVGGWKPAENTAAVSEYLLLYQADADHWTTTSSRPPSEASPFTTNYVALRGLRSFGTPEQKERIAKRTAQVLGWLVKTPAKETEDRVFRLRALQIAAAAESEVQAATKELLATQKPDGGWSQLEGGEADAYATGTALAALQEAGSLSTSDAAYQRGLRYLLSTQLADGSWLVHSRSKPFQKYFETGFPHGTDQFISCAASAWAATAIALACEKPTSEAGR